MFKITRIDNLAENVFLTEIEAAPVAASVHPGHHVEIQVDSGSAPLTLPVSSYDRDRGTFVVVHDMGGPSGRLNGSDEVLQVRGPLGAACKVDELKKVVFAAEDLGVASLYCRARKYKEKGSYSICVLGFEAKDHVFWEKEFSAVSDELYICTRDGSYGVNGLITNPVRAVCETHKNVERIIMIGQLDKMKKVAKVASDYDITALMSFDAVREPAGKPSVFDAGDTPQEAFAFARAPEIDANEINFDKLLARQRALQKESEKPQATP